MGRCCRRDGHKLYRMPKSLPISLLLPFIDAAPFPSRQTPYLLGVYRTDMSLSLFTEKTACGICLILTLMISLSAEWSAGVADNATTF